MLLPLQATTRQPAQFAGRSTIWHVTPTTRISADRRWWILCKDVMQKRYSGQKSLSTKWAPTALSCCLHKQTKKIWKLYVSKGMTCRAFPSPPCALESLSDSILQCRLSPGSTPKTWHCRVVAQFPEVRRNINWYKSVKSCPEINGLCSKELTL